MTHYSDQNKLDKIVKEATSNSDDTEKALTAILNKLALEDFTLFDKCTIDEKNCNCESCNGKRCLAAYSLEELKAIQTYWLELRQYIRIVYRLSMKGSLKNIDNEYRDYMKDIVSRLCDACDPHQLYIKLEAQVKEFVIEIKVRLLQLMDRLAENPQLPRLFISGLLDRYNKMMNAAHEITPVLIQLEAQHLVKFNLTWKILNQRLFQTNIYSDLFFQNSVPLFITQLGKARDSEDNKKLVRDFLRFDDEISHVEEIWGDIEARIRQYMLTEVTPIPKEFIRGDGSKISGSPLFPPNCECHVCIEEVPPDHVGEIDEIIPLSPKTASFHLLSHIHGNREESVLSVYPPVFESTGLPTDHDPEHEIWCRDNLPTREGITKEMLEHHSCQLSKSGKKSVDKNAQKALEINGLCKEFERLEENHKGGSTGKGKTEGHNLHCSKHTEAMRRMQLNAFEDGFLDTDSSDSGPTDPRHCDCCYCEVFGHGMPPTAPMSKNYQEMRERLRLLLNKKKLKCKSSPVSTTPQATQKKPPPTSSVANSSNTAQDTRALEDLLDFIEGNEVKCRDEKKAAKKARQKEKKRVQLIRKKMEEEEQAKKIRLREEEIKRKALEEEARRKRREETNAAALIKAANTDKQKSSVKLKKKTKAVHHVQPQTQLTGVADPAVDKPSPQMVTIKRVMEPHNSEPTVTITLRGATPNQDRVLYTLLNGQVCKVKDMPPEKVSVSTKETQTKDGKIQAKSKPCGNNAPKPPASVPTRVKEPPSKIMKPKSEPVKPKPQIPTKVVTPKTNKEVLSAPSVQINNGVNISKSSSSTSSFNIADIKLPPGITITKVDPSNVQPRNPKIQEHSVKKVVTNSKQDVRCSSEVIVVSTSKKEPQEVKGSLPDQESLASKKKRNRKKNNSQMLTNGKPTGYPGLEIEPISLLEKEDVSNHMSVLTISPYQDQESSREQQWVSDNGKKKKKKTKKSPINNLINPEEWQLLESVFAPKDIDLDDGEMDDAERELEAFKRFCLQSIPPERKEKVHLNIKDIVLKKKSSPYN